MSNIIHQLPDHIANQIAAGEVIQRPASVIKELVENAVDAGATKIIVNIRDAGKTLIQVSDNGKGMSASDARMAFERHATSKIQKANDLFHLSTMGFRGEALASIAAIANITLTTRQKSDELGTKIQLSGSEVQAQEHTQCPVGASFSVKNLFFNVPARRKFLKADSTEFRHINEEFIRISLTRPDIHFELIHNGTHVHNLSTGNTKQRIVGIFGKSYNTKLIPVETETTLAKIYGFIGTTDLAKKRQGEQYFFVNNRYMRHPYFYKAVMTAYDNLLQKTQHPTFFLYFDVDPEQIDVNIHPTKTEIKFENDKSIWQILLATIKESIGRHNLVPSIDFETEHRIDIPVPSARQEEARPPEIKINPGYNPFDKQKSNYSRSDSFETFQKKTNPDKNWESLYKDFDEPDEPAQQSIKLESRGFKNESEETQAKIHPAFFQVKERYILSQVKSGLMLIDQKRAHERILFENLQANVMANKSSTQKSLFPEIFEANPESSDILREIIPELSQIGFVLEEEKPGQFSILGIPGELTNLQPVEMIDNLLSTLDEADPNLGENLSDQIAAKLAQISSLQQKKQLSQEEMKHLTENLFSCKMPNYTPGGKPVMRLLTVEDIDKLLTI